MLGTTICVTAASYGTVKELEEHLKKAKNCNATHYSIDPRAINNLDREVELNFIKVPTVRERLEHELSELKDKEGLLKDQLSKLKE